jgi:two-component system, sensor histidine kinase RegB
MALFLSERPVGAIDATRRNVLLLVQLRWLATFGQLATILIVHFWVGVQLPLIPMLAALAVLALLNLAIAASRGRWPASDAQLFATLLIDVLCLTIELYLSGGVRNPFVSLYLLQVVLAAVLLPPWSSWTLVVLTSVFFAALAHAAPFFALPMMYGSSLSGLYVAVSWFNFTLTASLLVLFVTRIVRNISERDARLAALRQRAAEEEHIVRMGLLASGAAHELGTPLASLSVALGDWRTIPTIATDAQLADEVSDMQAQVARCKAIVAGILFAAGEVTGEAPERTTLRQFVHRLIEHSTHGALVTLDDRLGGDLPIVADRALGQALTNLIDNAVEAGASKIRLVLARADSALLLVVQDNGGGFPPAILPYVGQPYRSTKERQGAGLGLFLATNVLRTLGGTLEARNLAGRGAQVTLRLPLEALALDEEAA